MTLTLEGLDQEARVRRYRRDPWLWLREAVWTVDEVDKAHPVKPFPVAVCVPCETYVGGAAVEYAPADGDDYQGGRCASCGGALQEVTYLRHLTRGWQAAGNKGGGYRDALGVDWPWPWAGHPPIMAVPKPRRMRLSWLMVSLHTWLALFTPHAKVFIMSSKQEKSAELIERSTGILTRMPAGSTLPVWQWDGRPADRGATLKAWGYHATGTVRGGVPMIEFTNGARLWGVGEGADQLRQYGATAVFCDEIGTWANPRASYGAIRPTIEGGGQLTMVSSAYPGFWGDVVSGRLTA